MAEKFMKEPCQHCPYRRDVRPFLRVERAEELAYLAHNRYADFVCHKTIEHDDDTGEGIVTRKSLTCAGFLTLQICDGGSPQPEGFEPSDLVYESSCEMVEAYEAESAGDWSKPL